VTGATGFVGYNIVDALLKRNRRVRALVRSVEKGKRLLPEQCELIKGDITDIDSLGKAMKDCSIVYHSAGLLALHPRASARGILAKASKK